jgi:site-specific DNA recombinase
MTRCGLYIRVSTDMQKERGESLSVQLKRLTAYVESKGDWVISERYEDAGISAKNTNRPEFSRMMSDVENGKLDAILCTKLDRLFRNTRDFLDTADYFDEKNINFVCLDGNIDTSTASGRVYSTMRAAFAQFERETTAERVRDVMKSRAEQGKWNGGPSPYGYRNENKQLIIDEKESLVVKKIYDLYIKHKSLRFVTHKLNTDGIKTRKNELWAVTSVKRILTNPLYYGVLVYNKRSHSYKGELKHNTKDKYIRGQGTYPTIISKELFDTVQIIIKQQTKTAPRKNAKYLLAGLVYCAECGSRMHGQRSKENHTYYRCYGHLQKGIAKCSGKNAIRVDTLDRLLIKQLKKSKINYNDLKESVKNNAEFSNKDADSIKEKLQALESQLKKAQIKRQKMFELYEEGSISKKDFLERKTLTDNDEAFINKEIEELKARLNKVDINLYDLESTLALCNDMKEVYDELDFIERKELLNNLISEIKVDKHHIDYTLQVLPKVFKDISNLGKCINLDGTDRDSWPPPA